MDLLKIWEDWAKKNGYTSLTQDGIIKTMVTEFCKHLESIPIVPPVKPESGDLNVGQLKQALEKYPNDYEVAIEIKKKDNTVEWLKVPKTHKYFRIVLYEE